jgi:hypothetical protein
MKNESVRSINIAGLVGYIITVLLIICSISAMVFTGILTAASISVTKENPTVTVSTDVNINANGNILEKLNRFIGIDGVENLSDLAKKDADLKDSTFASVNVEQNDGSMVINAETNETVFSTKRVIAGFVSVFVWLGSVTVALEMILRLMKKLRKCETPFSEDVIKWMDRFATSLIPATVLGMIAKGIWSGLLTNHFTFSLDLGSVLLVAVIYLLVIVFKYGAQLQRESDETL